MRIVLLETNPETTPIFETWCAYLGIHLTAVTSERLLHHEMRRAEVPDLLILDCSRGQPGDVALCRRVALRSGIETWVLAGGSGLVEALAPAARVPLAWLPTEVGGYALLERLRTAQRRIQVAREGTARGELSDGESEVAALLRRGCTVREVAERRGRHVGTVKRQVGRILGKWGLSSLAELRTALRYLPDDVAPRPLAGADSTPGRRRGMARQGTAPTGGDDRIGPRMTGLDD